MLSVPVARVIIGKWDSCELRFLVLLRADTNRWEFPGGKIEAEELAHEAARREVKEETGLEVTISRFIGYTNPTSMDGAAHSVELYFSANAPEGVVRLENGHTAHQWLSRAELTAMEEKFMPSGQDVIFSLGELNILTHWPDGELFTLGPVS